jgi:hypothetical protein
LAFSQEIVMPVNPAKYNKARDILGTAGSMSAKKSHKKHDTDSVPDDHGKSLLREARDEFRKTDKGKPGLKSDMLPAHYDAIHKAATEMGITSW